MKTSYILTVVEELIKNQDNFISGSFLGKQLGISRTAIKKIIDGLEKKGYVISGRTGAGYCLLKLPEYPETHAVQALLNLRGFGNIKYSYEAVVDSTQQEAARFLTKRDFRIEPEQHFVFVAGKQTRGKGRMGRPWYSDEGGIWMTFIFNRPVLVKDLNYYPLASAISVIDFLKRFFGISCKLKWPNDVVIDNKKIAGILVSGRIEVDLASQLVIGVGVNVNNQLAPEIKKLSTSVAELTGKKYELLMPVVELITSFYNELTSINPEKVIQRANDLLWKKEKEGWITGPTGKKEKVVIKKIGSSGELIADVDGEEKEFFAAEIDFP
jgi:BirA family biotin operon repressor/biotin-[acetyl-CoA-carboxylase] ligase